MPNHTENILRVSGPQDQLDAFEAACRGFGARYVQSEIEREFYKESEPVETCMSFHGIVPVPADVQAQTYDKAGYGWQREHWGTKWDAYGPPVLLKCPTGKLIYMFETAWCPPRKWLRAACVSFPTLRFELFARDEYPYCVSIEAQHYDGELQWEECYGEQCAQGGAP